MLKSINFLRSSKAFFLLWQRRWRRGSTDILRLFIKFAPSENRRVFGLMIITGAVCGLAAVAFYQSISIARSAAAFPK